MAGDQVDVRRQGPIDPMQAQVMATQAVGLQRLQVDAEKWVTIISTITGVSAVVGFGLTPGELSSLSTTSQWVVVLSGLAAILSIAAAVFLGGQASSGAASKLIALTPNEVQNDLTSATRGAIDNLRLSRILTVIGVALAALAIGWSLLGGKAGPSDSRWMYTQASATPDAGRVVCGDLVMEQGSGNLFIDPDPADTTTTVQAVTDQTALTATDDCPDYE